ncbi:MAG: type II toxin-antitoxin system VapC family toxin [Bosea sp. (in: a-proteobacteria)]
MPILLDTHAFIWAMTEPDMLSQQAQAALRQNPDVFLSAAAIWEIAIKRARFGEAALPFSASEALAMAQEAELEILPISAQHAELTEHLPPHHRDPFDRIMIAQARLEGMSFMTRDAVITRYEIETIPA